MTAAPQTSKVPTIINLWASWCGPCRKEMPDLETLHREAAALVTGVNSRDTDAAAVAFCRSNGITYPSIVDEDNSLLLAWGALPQLFFPSSAVVDSSGRLAARVTGGLSLQTFRDVLVEVEKP